MTPIDPIITFNSSYKSAVYNRDVPSFVALYAPHVRVFDAWGAWSVDGLDGWKKMATEWFGSLGDERVVVDFEEVQSTVGDRVAAGSAFVTYTAVDAEGKKLRALQNRHSWILEKVADRWQVVHEHSSAPADFETLKISLKR